MYQRIRELRKEAGLTQVQTAELLGCPQRIYETYASGHQNVPIDIFLRLAEIHGASIDYLLGRTDKRTLIESKKPRF